MRMDAHAAAAQIAHFHSKRGQDEAKVEPM